MLLIGNTSTRPLPITCRNRGWQRRKPFPISSAPIADHEGGIHLRTDYTVEDFERDLLLEDRSPHTVRTQAGAVRRFLAWAASGGIRSYVEVQAEDVRDYRELLKRQQRKPATVNGAILALRRFYALAGASADDNPAARIQLVKEQAMAPKDLDRNQLNRLMREARSVSEGATERQRLLATRDATILALLRETGIRVSELVSLTPADVFTQERRLWVHIRGKGQKERNVPLNELASQFLRAWLDVRPADLPTLFGVGDRMVRLRLREIGRRAKIEGVHPHTLRHSFARGVLDEGGNLVDIAAILGHNSVRTTQRYTQPRPKSLIKTVDLLDPH